MTSPGESAPGETYASIPAQIVDRPVFQGGLTKEHLEDIQLYSFLQALVLDRQADHPIEVSAGADPPDRVIRDASGKSMGLELTQLTIGSIRHDLAEARKFGRGLDAEIRRDPARFEHLKGRHVMLSVFPPPSPPMPRQHDSLISEVAEALAVDRGTFRDEGVPPEGLPNEIGPDGIYGSKGPVGIGVRAGGIPDDFVVISSAQVDLHRDQVRSALDSILAAKDRPGNDALLISIAAPDSAGYVCPADEVLFHFLHEDIQAGRVAPPTLRHIKVVYIHHWFSRNWFQWNLPSAT